MYKKKNLAWSDPLEMAYSIACDPCYQGNWAFLYSGLLEHNSYLALFPKQEIISNDFQELTSALLKPDQYWFGYLGYDLKNQLESLKPGSPSAINLPDLWMVNYQLILQFNHQEQKIICHYSTKELLAKIPGARKIKAIKIAPIAQIKSNFSKKKYFQKLAAIKQYIIQGDVYQANLTRKFFGKFKKPLDNHFDLFIGLNKSSPANYSSFLKLDDNYIISSSPELFLAIENNYALSSPIKGSAPRSLVAELDEANKRNLQNSPKEQAENLMIVDLVRNDLSRNCLVNSVQVTILFKISSYKSIHHMSSDIIGKLLPQSSALDVVKSCFPPASMTGAPKIKAMEICGHLERKRRGVYSGAIGFFKDNQCKLSVVIRTIIIHKKNFEFQVGGAITFDSNPQKEWQETIIKSKGIASALKINLSTLKKL